MSSRALLDAAKVARTTMGVLELQLDAWQAAHRRMADVSLDPHETARSASMAGTLHGMQQEIKRSVIALDQAIEQEILERSHP